MMNCTLSPFGFILFVMAFISYYQYCSLANLMYANLVQVCTAINREFIFPGAKKKKREREKKKKEWASGIQCLFCYPVLPMA